MVPVVARTAGVFTLKIRLASPDGGLILASSEDTVRSTAASGVGILLSIGAALLLAAGGRGICATAGGPAAWCRPRRGGTPLDEISSGSRLDEPDPAGPRSGRPRR